MNSDVEKKILAGARLTFEDALALWDLDLLTLGRWANYLRRQRHPEAVVTYVVDRNINYTNICVSGCRFCAFFRPPGHPEGYVLSWEELERKLTALEEKMIAILRSRQSEEEALAARREMDAELRPYRSKMPAAQLAMLEQQYLERRLLEKAGLPRLSLFYLR